MQSMTEALVQDRQRTLFDEACRVRTEGTGRSHRRASLRRSRVAAADGQTS
jgi:hypothetical protein